MTYEPITKAWLKAVSAEQLRMERKDPVRSAEIDAYLRSREAAQAIAEIAAENVGEAIADPADEVVIDPNAQAAQDAQEAETARLAAEAEQAEAARLAQEAEAARQIPLATPRKIVVEYQAKDEAGNPIGRPTHLEAYSWEEMSKKQTEAHIQATRAFHRLKAQKTTFNRQEPVAPVMMSDAELVQAAEDLKGDDTEKAAVADRKLRANQILEQQAQLAIQRQQAKEKEAALVFMTNHIHDYNRCQANSKILSAYLKDNDLEWTPDNLELAFAATESQLAPVAVAPVSDPESVDNPPAPDPTAPANASATVIQPVAKASTEVPTTQAPAANPPAAAPRPGVNAGIIPGQNSGVRPSVRPQGLTMKEIHGWKADQMKKERANPARRAEIDRVIAAYNKERAARI
jgi:hypothetical protein